MTPLANKYCANNSFDVRHRRQNTQMIDAAPMTRTETTAIYGLTDHTENKLQYTSCDLY